MAVKDSTQRFSSRVENYVRYRPAYPPAVLDLLKSDCGLTAASVIADIAFGTGIFTRMLLENGNRVFGVEPNPDMRKAGEEFLILSSLAWREQRKPRLLPIAALT
jgi:SAM-dependent methyltransferase